MAEKQFSPATSLRDNLGQPAADTKPTDVEKSSTCPKAALGEVQDDGSADLQRIIHRIDRRLIVTAGFMYCVSLIDRANLGAANIAGMSADLGLDIGYRYVSKLIFHLKPPRDYYY